MAPPSRHLPPPWTVCAGSPSQPRAWRLGPLIVVCTAGWWRCHLFEERPDGDLDVLAFGFRRDFCARLAEQRVARSPLARR